MLIYILYTIFFLSCIVLVAAVLLQPGKTDAGALFTSNVSSAAYGPRGTATVLSKLTIAAATVFMLTALLISMPAVTGKVSVLQTSTTEPADAPANANTVTPADANSASNTATTPADANTAANSTAPANTEAPANK